MRKTLLSIFVVFLIGLSGCASKQASTVESSKKVVVWHWLTDRQDTFLELAKMYKEKTGVDVVFELYAPSDIYSQKVRAAAQTDTLPDIYGILAEKKDFSSFIKAGHVANLTSYMEQNNNEWKDAFFIKALEVNIFESGNEFGVTPGIYGAPLDVMNIQMLYNKSLFKKAGLDPENPPATWEEFLEAGNKLKAAGIRGMVSGWGEIWLIGCFAYDYAFNIMGEDKVIATLRGDVPYTDPDWVTVFRLFEDMRDNNLLASGIVTMVNKVAEQAFANERAAFGFNGSWGVNVYYGMNPNLDYGVMLPPAYSSKYPMRVLGGPGGSFMVNNKSSNREKAIEFLRWFTSKNQQAYLAKETRNLPANKESLSVIPPILSHFADDMDGTYHWNNLPVVEKPQVTEMFSKGIQAIIIGEKTPEEVASEVQALKERL
ncbi:MAG: extracellular solute-binding protein [Candidatus Omnitrophica bacterium]|nr:extracellular solute-binding protein [Candidatus Omnitrophota bacterium]